MCLCGEHCTNLPLVTYAEKIIALRAISIATLLGPKKVRNQGGGGPVHHPVEELNQLTNYDLNFPPATSSCLLLLPPLASSPARLNSTLNRMLRPASQGLRVMLTVDIFSVSCNRAPLPTDRHGFEVRQGAPSVRGSVFELYLVPHLSGAAANLAML
jgi:hypothetical protein